MKIIFSTSALKDYREFEQKNPQVFKRINRLLQSIKETPFDGIGKPQPLKHKWTGARIEDSPVVQPLSGQSRFATLARMRRKHDEHADKYMRTSTCG